MPAASPDSREKRSRAGPIAALVLGLLLLYALSIGPAQWAIRRDHISMTTFHRAYRPILWVCVHSPSFDRAVYWYSSLLTDMPAPNEPPK